MGSTGEEFTEEIFQSVPDESTQADTKAQQNA